MDGEDLDPVAVVERLEAIGAPFGIGRGIHLGDTIIGTKGRVAFEAPAAEILLTAHRELEDRQFGVVNVQPDYATASSGLDAGRARK